ncbi:MAG: F0F1 ATP synthase subunit gamma [Actinobacteria bacterium]|nr:MAG: F0F1 ATP synthase subunit gamma [Actinomycetota bacterium]
MQKLVEVRSRMRAVTSIGGVCRTMATVASAKLSRTRERAAGIREYTRRMREIIGRQQRCLEAAGRRPGSISPFLSEREVREVLLLHVASDRGMCGGYNLAVYRVAAAFVAEAQAAGAHVRVVTKGTRGEYYVRRRLPGLDVADAAGWSRAGVTPAEVDRYHEMLTGAFLAGECDEVWCSYTRFLSPVRREPAVVRLLPVKLGEIAGDSALAEEPVGDAVPEHWFYEPSAEAIVTELLGEFVRLQVEDVLLEAFASEQAARMITMEEAVERADRTLHDLRVRYNRLRRESITTDMLGVLYAGRLRGGRHGA